MKVHVIGAGPAGLSLAKRLKILDHTNAVVVWEKSERDATRGWGVILSSTARSWLAKTDPATYARISDYLEHWDSISIRKGSEIIKTTGHPYVAIARDTLLEALQEQCEEVGVDIQWSTAMTPEHVASLMQDPQVDLICATDGINSVVRGAYREVFGETELRKSRFVWLGTTRRFANLTFIFVSTPFGVFHAHAYPFSGDLSTFIIQCDEDVWQRCGLAALSVPDQMTFCEEIFKTDLEGHPLQAGNSKWSRFVSVKNQRLYHEKLVLLGDAASAVHFSVGSGIRLAMEGAAVLAKSLQTNSSITAATQEYSRVMIKFTEPIQVISDRSARFFEQLTRDLDQPITQFSLRLLTRTGNISYELLRRHDPVFINRLEHCFRGSVTANPRRTHGEHSWHPTDALLLIRGKQLVNRGVLTLQTDTDNEQCFFETVEYLKPGLVLIAPAIQSQTSADNKWNWPDLSSSWNTRAAQMAADNGTMFAIMMRYSNSVLSEAPSVLADLVFEATRKQELSGFDILMLSFESASWSDASLDARSRRRFFADLTGSVRLKWPNTKPLALSLPWNSRIVPDEREKLESFSTCLRERGVDLLRIQLTEYSNEPIQAHEACLHLCDVLRSTGLTILLGGRSFDRDERNLIVGAGRADLCEIAYSFRKS